MDGNTALGIPGGRSLMTDSYVALDLETTESEQKKKKLRKLEW